MRLAAVFGCIVSLTLISAVSAHAAPGDLTQLDGALGCTRDVAKVDLLGCAPGTSLDNPEDMALSADGENAYVASALSNAIAIFDYDAPSGAMVQKPNPDGCINRTPDGSGGTCRVGTSTWFVPRGVAVSPDGENVYVAANTGILTFDRDTTTGDLTQKAQPEGCFGSAAGCSAVKGVNGAGRIVVSPDGRNVYVTSSPSTIATFDRSLTTGVLSQQTAGTKGCINETGANGCADGKALEGVQSINISPDGKGVYVTTNTSGDLTDGIAILDRDTTTGSTAGELTQSTVDGEGCISEDPPGAECADGSHLDVASAIAFSPGGEHVYVIGDEYTIVTFDRSATTNELTQKPGAQGCLTHDGIDNACATGRVFRFPTGLAMSPDGKNLYVSTQDDWGVASFDRDTATGVLTQKAGDAGCMSSMDFWWSSPPNPYGYVCRQSRVTRFPVDVAVHPNGEGLYLPISFEDAFAVFARDDGTIDPGPGPGPTQPTPPNLFTERPVPPPQPSTVRRIRVSTRPGNGTVEIEVTTTGPGRITVNATAPVNVFSGASARAAARRKRVARAVKTVKKAKKVALVLKPTKKAKRVLRREGRLKARVQITFKPASGAASTVTRKPAVFRLRRR